MLANFACGLSDLLAQSFDDIGILLSLDLCFLVVGPVKVMSVVNCKLFCITYIFFHDKEKFLNERKFCWDEKAFGFQIAGGWWFLLALFPGSPNQFLFIVEVCCPCQLKMTIAHIFGQNHSCYFQAYLPEYTVLHYW